MLGGGACIGIACSVLVVVVAKFYRALLFVSVQIYDALRFYDASHDFLFYSNNSGSTNYSHSSRLFVRRAKGGRVERRSTKTTIE